MAILSDEFYYQLIRIDTINTRVYADIIAKEGDANGRGLLLTLTENGLMKDTTGIALNLKWEHTSVGNQGLDNFDAVDLSKGLYKITYPTEMLNRGKIRAFIQIVDSGKLAGTRNIEITVDRGVGDDIAIASSDSFSALASALIEVQSWNDRIDDVEQDFIDRANNLDATYPTRLVSVETQLVDIDLEKVDKNGSGQVGWSNIAQDARLQIIGTTAPAVGTNANGTYVKFSDGTMICHGRVSISSLAITSVWGALYLSPALKVIFPATFVEAPPAITANMENTTGDIATWYNVLASKNSFDGYFGSAVSRTFACTLSWMAVGRWK